MAIRRRGTFTDIADATAVTYDPMDAVRVSICGPRPPTATTPTTRMARRRPARRLRRWSAPRFAFGHGAGDSSLERRLRRAPSVSTRLTGLFRRSPRVVRRLMSSCCSVCVCTGRLPRVSRSAVTWSNNPGACPTAFGLPTVVERAGRSIMIWRRRTCSSRRRC